MIVVAITDRDWFEYLAGQAGLDEVNFWRPSDKRTPRQIRPGTPLVFKLRKEFGGWIVGYGIFARFERMPVWLAWESFERKNGAPSLDEMRRRIERIRGAREGDEKGDYEIGCLMLSNPTFLVRDQWIEGPRNWKDNTVQGKGYRLEDGEGARIWQALQLRAVSYEGLGDRANLHTEHGPRYGQPTLVRPRLGQGTFRMAVTGAYGRSCAVTGEHSLPALDAAHIRDYQEGGLHEVSNGLLLRSDIHRLFDKGYVGVTRDHRFIVSRRLRADYDNGRSYYPLDGSLIRLPESSADKPDPIALDWHLKHRFRDD